MIVPVACGGEKEAPIEVEPWPPGDHWIPIALDDHPELEAEGGSIVVQNADVFIDVNLLHLGEERYAAIWRICPHGACFVELYAARAAFECPCHGSRFDLEGRLQLGPAEVGLRALNVVKKERTIWIEGQRLRG